MSRFGLILLIPIILSCSMLERKNDIVYSSKHIHTDSSKIIPPDYLAVLMSRELTEKTTFVIDGNVWESMLINKDSKFQRHLFNALSCKDKENYTEAMESLILAQESLTDNIPSSYIGLMYMGKAVVYRYMNAHYKSLKASLKASQYFDPKHDTESYFDSLLEVARSYYLLGYYADAGPMLSMLQPSLSELNSSLRAKYYDTLLSSLMSLDQTKIPEVIENMRTDVEEKNIYWLNVVYIANILGLKDLAVEAMDKYRIHNPDYEDNLAYHGVAVGLFNNSGQYLEASKSYRKYAEGVEKMLMNLVESDILNIEQINMASAKGVKYKQISLILAVCILLVLSISCIVWRMMKHRLNKKQDEIVRYSELLKEVENETERLRELYENKTLDKELRNVLMQRMDILNQFILSRVSPNYSDNPAENELRSLIDSKDNFLGSTCKTFEALHPEFTAFLVSFDLTERERGCCCLYCMGLRGNEIASYMGLTDQSYYNLSGAIRKKLGLMEYKTKLDFFLREKLRELEKIT